MELCRGTAGGPSTRRGDQSCSLIRGPAVAGQGTQIWSSGHANEGSTSSSSNRTRISRRWSVKPWRAERTRLASPAATAHWRPLPRRPERTDSRSCAFRRAPATISRSTLASIDTTWSARSMRSRTGVERSIDVAEVNGLVFLNNVSLGIYGDAVQQPAYRDAKLRTLAKTAAEMLGPSAAIPELQLVDDLGREHPHPAVVLVSNNPYAVSRPLVTGTRPSARQRPAGNRRPRRATPGRGSSRAGLDRHPARGERGSAGSCRRRRRGGRPPRFARVRDPTRRAPRQDLHPSPRRVAVGPAPVMLERAPCCVSLPSVITGLLRARGHDQPQDSSEARTTSAVSPAHRSDT